jgi:hypothetical protein
VNFDNQHQLACCPRVISGVQEHRSERLLHDAVLDPEFLGDFRRSVTLEK